MEPMNAKWLVYTEDFNLNFHTTNQNCFRLRQRAKNQFESPIRKSNRASRLLKLRAMRANAFHRLIDTLFVLFAGKECAFELRVNKTHGERTEVSFFKDAEIDAEKCFDIVFLYRENRFEICSGG